MNLFSDRNENVLIGFSSMCERWPLNNVHTISVVLATRGQRPFDQIVAYLTSEKYCVAYLT